MRAVVVVRGAVDERDVWPYASWSGSDGEHTTLSVTVHDSQELVGVISSLTALGLEVVSTRLAHRRPAARDADEASFESISSSESDDSAEVVDDSEEL